MTEPDDDPAPAAPRYQRALRSMVWATPGQLDAGFASLATFGAGIYAVRELSTEGLAAYALLFAAFHFANQFPSELVMIPAQILGVDLEPASRLGMLRHSLPYGMALAGLGALIVPFGALPVFSVVTPAELVPLIVTIAVLALVSPVQDHVRAMYHLAGRSWVAARMSGLHFVVTVVAIFGFSRGLPAWTPFGALASGNVASLALAAAVFRRIHPTRSERPPLREFTSIGSWLLFTGLTKNGLGYAGRALLNAIVGTAALGFVEGARVAAQPINVLALGLMSQTGPKLTEAGSRRDEALARRWRTRFLWLFAGVTVPFIAITAVPWALNPLAQITPRAFEVPGLTAAMLGASAISGLVRPYRNELLGARLFRLVTSVAIAVGILEIGLVLAGGLLGAFVVPLGLTVGSVAAAIIFRRRLVELYGRGPRRDETEIGPDFIVAAAPRSGTTSLFRYLAQHPEIEMSDQKEPGFFHFSGSAPDFEALAKDQGEALRAESLGNYSLARRAAVTDSARYGDLWTRNPNAKIRGEGTPTYLFDPEAMAAIKAANPLVKLVVILRDPTARAYSEFVQRVRHGIEPAPTFAEALALEPVDVDDFWWGARRYLRTGLYTGPVERAFGLFGRESVHVVLYEDLVSEPARVLSDVTSFLDVDASFAFDTEKAYKTGLLPKESRLVAVARSTGLARRLAHVLVPRRVRSWLWGRIMLEGAVEPPAMPEATCDELTAFFDPHNRALGRLLDRDLSSWNGADQTASR